MTGDGSDKSFSNAKADRKLRKPLIEKRRRERINCSLEQLKGIMVDAYNLDQSKLEKADVLEVTVQHMEGLQKNHGAGNLGLGSVAGFESRHRYSSGYIQCMHEVHNLLLSCPGMDKTLGARLLNHLLKSLPHVSADVAGAAITREPDSPSQGNGVGINAVAQVGMNGATNGSVVSSALGSFGAVHVAGSDASVGGRTHGRSPLPHPPSSSSSPPTSPISPPGRGPFKPRRLELHPPSSSPQTTSQPPRAAVPSADGGATGVGERPPAAALSSSYVASPSSSPAVQRGGGVLPSGPPNMDPSMWRPW